MYNRRCLFVFCLFVCLLPTLCKNFRTDLHEIFRQGWQPVSEDSTLVAIRITAWTQGLFFGFVTIGRYGKWYQSTALRDAAVHDMH